MEWEPTGRGPLDVKGTLILAIRSVYAVENLDGIFDSARGRVVDRHHGVLVLGGMAFVEGVQLGTDLEGRDPTYLIEQTLLMLAGKDFDRECPGLETWRIRVEEVRREKEERRARVAAKALAILTAHLDEEQLVELETTGEFHVIGADGYQYLITKKGHHNVFRIEDGKQTFMYCIVTQGFVPEHDQMLAQMLLLQANPVMFHEITNTWEMGEDGKWKLVKKSRDPDPIGNPFAVALQDLDLG